MPNQEGDKAMSVDWFRNKSWSPEIERAFQAKLAKSRAQGPEYIYIQAVTLLEAENEPEVSLQLVDQYIATGATFRMADCFAVQAGAFVLLSLIDAAIDAYQRALAWEELHPGSISRSRYELPYLIATRGKREHYELAISLLQSSKLLIVFSVDKFMYACSLALIYSDCHDSNNAIKFAKEALDAAAVKGSPLPRHRGIGLVGRRFAPEVARLNHLIRAGGGVVDRV